MLVLTGMLADALHGNHHRVKARNKEIGFAGEDFIDTLFNDLGWSFCRTSGHKHPIDGVLWTFQPYGVEIKVVTYDTDTNHSTNNLKMNKQAIRDKKKFCKDFDLQPLTIAIHVVEEIYDEESKQLKHMVMIRARKGFKGYVPSRMPSIMEELR